MSYSQEQLKILHSYFTDPTGDTFALTNLPQSVAAALFARYSRTRLSIREIFLKEFWNGNPDAYVTPPIGLHRAKDFLQRNLAGFGDDSIAQLAAAHLAMENISNLAVQYLEDARIGIAFLEKSSRYVAFDQKIDGCFQYYLLPVDFPWSNAQQVAYERCMDDLFRCYSDGLPIVMGHLKKTVAPEAVNVRHPQTSETVTLAELYRDGELSREETEKAAEVAFRSRAFDSLRSLLPLSTLTNVGMLATAQAYEHLMNKMLTVSLHIPELHGRAFAALNQLSVVLPGMLNRVGVTDYMAKDRKIFERRSEGYEFPDEPLATAPEDSLYNFGLCSVIAEGAGSWHPAEEELEAAFLNYVGDRTSRRDKPGRRLEVIDFVFGLEASIGSYRDLHRHRLCTQEREEFSTKNGYIIPEDFPPEFRDRYCRVMDACDALYRSLATKKSMLAQYCVPFGYKVRWYMKINLRELLHICELRTTPQGHPEYRKLCQRMWKSVVESFPYLDRIPHFVNFNDYELGRLSQEIKSTQGG